MARPRIPRLSGRREGYAIIGHGAVKGLFRVMGVSRLLRKGRVYDKRLYERKLNQLAQLSRDGKLVRTTGYQRSSSLTKKYKADVLARLKDRYDKPGQSAAAKQKLQDLMDRVRKMDVDHRHDLQLGGPDVRGNLKLLDKTSNTSIGALVRARMSQMGIGPGTTIRIAR